MGCDKRKDVCCYQHTLIAATRQEQAEEPAANAHNAKEERTNRPAETTPRT